MQTDELLDLVDEHDRVIGVMPRSEVHRRGLSNFRVINVFLVNKEGKLWIPRRAPNKRLFPNALDMSAAGHVESGESYEDAFARETLEEVRIDVTKVPWKHLFRATPHEDGVSAFEQVYEIVIDQSPAYNPEDFTEAFWLTPEEVLERIRAGEEAKSDLPLLVRKLIDLRDKKRVG